MRNIPFSPPDMTEAEASMVSEVLGSGWITTGPKTKEFEHLISMCCGTSRAVCLNSATACMEMALRIIGVGPGDEVIVPAYTYTATASAVCHVGARPLMVDCAPGSYQMDYGKMAGAITERTKAVMPVDLGGVVCDYDRIFEAVEAAKGLFRPSNDIQRAFGRVIVIADAAHAFGARWHGKMCGDIADFTSFSFHAVKNLTTAEGGALTWRPHDGLDGEIIYKQLQLLSLHGQSKDALAKTKLGAWEYDIVAPYYKCNMTDIMAGIGLAQLKRYPELMHRRRQIIGAYNAALGVAETSGENEEGRSAKGTAGEGCTSGAAGKSTTEAAAGCRYGKVGGVQVQVLDHYGPEHSSSGHLYPVRMEGFDVEERNEVIVKMAERGIACNVHYKPLPMMTAYKALGYDIKDFPNAYNQYRNEITLPLHTHLSDEDVQYVMDNFTEIISSLKK